MFLTPQTAEHLVDAAVEALKRGPSSLAEAIDELPAPIYVTDREGVITHFNRACVGLAGRTPVAGKDQWCVTWKIFTTDGEFLPHDQCPMAVAIRERRPVRGVEAIAERPDGTRVVFQPYPTPLFDEEGRLSGAVNLLVDITHFRNRTYFREQAERCRRLTKTVTDRALSESLILMAAKYDEQALRLPAEAASTRRLSSHGQHPQ